MHSEALLSKRELSSAGPYISEIISELNRLIAGVGAMPANMGFSTYDILAAGEKQKALSRLNEALETAVALQQSLSIAITEYPVSDSKSSSNITQILTAMENGESFGTPNWVNQDYQGCFEGYTPAGTNNPPDWDRAIGGGGQALGGVLLILGGVAAVTFAVATLGAGTPAAVAYFGFAAGSIGSYAAATAVFGVGVAGVVTTAGGASELIEGGQDVVYGIGGSDRESVNIIRDYALPGREDLYYNTLLVSSIVSFNAPGAFYPYSSLTYKPTGTGTKEDPRIINVPQNKYPESAQHISNVEKGPASKVYTLDRPGTDSRRNDSLSGIPVLKGFDRDEWPPAVVKEGGYGANVRYISPSDNRGAGGTIGQQLKGLSDGAFIKFDTRPINPPSMPGYIYPYTPEILPLIPLIQKDAADRR